jgi:hypothetical protein
LLTGIIVRNQAVGPIHQPFHEGLQVLARKRSAAVAGPGPTRTYRNVCDVVAVWGKADFEQAAPNKSDI